MRSAGSPQARGRNVVTDASLVTGSLRVAVVISVA